MDKSWVSIKKGNQFIDKVPYQAYKDVFEKDGFELINDESLKANSTLSLLSNENKEQPKSQSKEIFTNDNEEQTSIKNEQISNQNQSIEKEDIKTNERPSNYKKSSKNRYR